jgi:DNA-binding response OmpR family regulator
MGMAIAARSGLFNPLPMIVNHSAVQHECPRSSAGFPARRRNLAMVRRFGAAALRSAYNGNKETSMTDPRSTPNLPVAELVAELERLEQVVDPVEQANEVADQAYRMKMGRQTIWLNIVEFRILRFLAASPYKPFSRRQIAEAISSPRHQIEEDAIDEHVTSLRERLGFFRDYVQTVPYIGYRFKE